MNRADHPIQVQHMTIIEYRLIDMLLKGMGDPLIALYCWDSGSITRHPQADVVAVYLKSRLALWRFLLNPHGALKASAHTRGITLEDSLRFQQVMRKARQNLPAETLMVNRLLGIHADNSSS